MMLNLPKSVVIVSKEKPENGGKNGPETKRKELLAFSQLAGSDLKKETQPDADLTQVQSFTIEKKDCTMGNERLIIGDQKFLYIIPDQLNTIVDRMLQTVAVKCGYKNEAPLEKLNFTEFSIFLNLNPALRWVVQSTFKPNLWTLQGTERGKHNTSFGCMAPTRPPTKPDQKTPRDKNYKVVPGVLQEMQGELFKIGRRTEKFIARYFELKEGCLIIFKDSASLAPLGIIYLALTIRLQM